MLTVGLTGNIAAGKSTVARAFQARGAVLIDSDQASRDAVRPGTPALAAISEHFGPAVLQPDGTLDRARLGAVVFANPALRTTLEAIIHPAVEGMRQARLREARQTGAAIVICDIPLLFEARLAWQFARIVLVDAPVATRVARLMRDRDMPEATARDRIRAQLPAALKRPRSDLVIANAGDLAALDAQVLQAWARLERWAAVAPSNRAA
jgi:dephospho-CoA kinase